GRIVPLFDTMLVHQGEGSGTPIKPHHIPFLEVESSHPTTSSIPLPSIPTTPIPTITQTNTTPIIQYSRRARIAQSSALPTVADEPASPVRDDTQGEACPTDSGFIADQDMATIAKSSTLPHDSAPRVTSPAVDEGTIVLAGETNVPFGNGFIPTAGPPATVISTGSKAEQQEREDMRMNEQIARDAEVARIHAEEEIHALPLEKKIELINDLVKYQEHYPKVHKFQSQQKRKMSKKQKMEYYMAVIKSNLGWRFKDFKGMTFEEIEAKFAEVWKQVEDFIPMGLKEEAERLKRKDLLRQLDREDLNQLWALVKEYLSIRPTSSDREMELWVELKRMYEPDPKDQMWTLKQNY
nr:hypothetical protein [Tanacetum cinerariifolium]